MLNKDIKYVLHPGFVKSKNDGDKHFIGPQQLMKLYRVEVKECLLHGSPRYELPKVYRNLNLIHLYPDPTGDYVIPEK